MRYRNKNPSEEGLSAKRSALGAVSSKCGVLRRMDAGGLHAERRKSTYQMSPRSAKNGERHIFRRIGTSLICGAALFRSLVLPREGAGGLHIIRLDPPQPPDEIGAVDHQPSATRR